MTSAPIKRQTAGAATGLSLVGAVSTTIANFGIAALAARESTTLVGIFFSVTALISILGNGSSLGAMTGMVYFTPRGLDEEGNPVNIRPIASAAAWPVAILSSLLGLAAFVLAPQIADWIGSENEAARETMIRVSAIAIPAWALSLVFLGATRALGTMVPHVAISQIFRPLTQLGLLIGVFVISDDPIADAHLVALAWMIPIVISAVLAIASSARMGVFSDNGQDSVTRTEFWAYTKPRSVSVLLQGILERVDVILIALLTNDSTAGIYGTITRFITAGNYMIFSATQAISPALRKSLAEKKFEQAQKLLTQATSWMVLISVPYFVMLAYKSEGIAKLMDSAVAPGATALTILAIGMVVSPLAGPVDMTLLMLGRSKTALLTTAIAVVTDVVLTIVLVPHFDLVGAAIAWVAAVAIQNIGNALFVYKTANLRTIGRSPITAAVVAIGSYSVPALLTDQSFTSVLVTGIIGTATYIVLAFYLAERVQLKSLLTQIRG